MKLRTKSTLFFVIFFLAVTYAAVAYVEYVVGDTFKKQIANDFVIIAEQSEGTYFTFLDGIKKRTVAWSSDAEIASIAKRIIKTEAGSSEHASLVKEFATYVTKSKMPIDETIFLVDLLDKNGIVIASTRPERIGTDELKEEQEIHAHDFSKTIGSSFKSAFVKSFVFEEDETDEPMMHVTARMFDIGTEVTPIPLPAVLLVHFANTNDLAHALGVDVEKDSAKPTGGRVTRMALLEIYKTSDIYLVDRNSVLVTPSRYMKNVRLRQKVDTLPVRECIDNGKEISAEYDNFQGSRVLGASMCFKDDGLVLIVEIQKDEVYAPLAALTRIAIAGGLTVLTIGLLVAIFFVRVPLARIEDVVRITKRVADGDLDARVAIKSKDEIGILSSMLNTMITSISDAKKELEASKKEIEEKALYLEKDIATHEKQEKELEESKKATQNLLEDSWYTGEKLKAESSRLETILASIGDALILIDEEYKVILVNPQALEVLAMSQEEVAGKDLREVMKLWKGNAELPLAMWPIEEMFLKKSIITTTIEDELSLATTRRATHLPIALSVAPLGGGLSGGVIVIHDTTADHELNEAKSGFISAASHQLRTPLTSIRWYSEMLLSEDVGPLNEAQKDFITEVHGGAERLYQTVDLLLGISRVESGKIKTEKKPIDMAVFTGEITKELASQIDEKGCTLSVLPPDGEPVIVSLDPLTLRQVILNLFSNAIRYTNSKDGIIEVAWKKNEAGNEVIYSVRDNGIGIPASVRDRIFSKFFRAENARTQVPDGSGLGLALVKELVGSWDGKVWFETEEGKGSTFFFTVPVTSS